MIYILLVPLYNNLSLFFWYLYYLFSQNLLCTELQPSGYFSLQFLNLLLFLLLYQSGKQWILPVSTVNERNNIEKNVVKPVLPDIVSLLIKVST